MLAAPALLSSLTSVSEPSTVPSWRGSHDEDPDSRFDHSVDAPRDFTCNVWKKGRREEMQLVKVHRFYQLLRILKLEGKRGGAWEKCIKTIITDIKRKTVDASRDFTRSVRKKGREGRRWQLVKYSLFKHIIMDF